MSLTVRQALNIPALQKCRIMAGEGGLDQEIRHVTVMDTPDIARWLRGSEFLLCNTYVIRDDVKQQIGLVTEAHNCNVAALGVKTRRFVNGLPRQMLERADALNLPVIEIPEECAWVDIMSPVYNHITSEQYSRLLKSSELHNRFTRLSLEGEGLDEITRTLGQIVEIPVVMINQHRELLQVYPKDWPGYEQLTINKLVSITTLDHQTLLDAHSVFRVDPEKSGMPWPALICSMARGEQQYGHLICLAEGRALVPEDLMAMEHAATVASLEILKLRAINVVRRRFRNNFLYDIFMGKMQDEEIIRSRAQHVDWNLRSNYGLFTMDIDSVNGQRDSMSSKEDLERIREDLFYSTRRCLESISKDSLLMQLSGAITVLVPINDQIRERHRREAASQNHQEQDNQIILLVAEQVKEYVERFVPQVQVTIGAGRVYPNVTQLSTSYHEAQKALRLGRIVWGQGSIAHYDNLGVYRVLHSANAGELVAFASEFLGPLANQGDENESVLLQTLEAYFEHNESVEETSKYLFVHPNTVRYRLAKVEERTGLTLSRNQHRVNLEIALKIKKFLKSEARHS